MENVRKLVSIREDMVSSNVHIEGEGNMKQIPIDNNQIETDQDKLGILRFNECVTYCSKTMG